jgi:hypothetical protein
VSLFRFTPEARADVFEIWSYIASDSHLRLMLSKAPSTELGYSSPKTPRLGRSGET